MIERQTIIYNTLHNKLTFRLSNMNHTKTGHEPHKNWSWTQILFKGNQLLYLKWHPSCCCSQNSCCKAYMRGGRDSFLWQMQHSNGHLWHRYSAMINQIQLLWIIAWIYWCSWEMFLVYTIIARCRQSVAYPDLWETWYLIIHIFTFSSVLEFPHRFPGKHDVRFRICSHFL